MTPEAPLSRVLFQTDALRIGSFRAHPGDPRFAAAGQPLRHLFVFPRTSVWIDHPGEEPFVADPSVVTYYNRGAVYRRRALAPSGDRCEWFAVAPALLAEVVAWFDPAVEERPDRPVPFTHGPADSGSYALQRALVRHVTSEAAPDPLLAEETALRVLARVLGQAYARRGARPRRAPAGPAREVAQRVRGVAAARLGERLSLGELGRAVAASPFHLCRLFKEATGSTVHSYLTDLRLRVALEQVAEPASNLSALAHDLGFASHSHFTTAFRRRFGTTPSAFRRAGGRLLRELASRLPAAG